jgi:hypothetical protein
MTNPAQAERDFDSTVLRLLLDVNVPCVKDHGNSPGVIMGIPHPVGGR